MEKNEITLYKGTSKKTGKDYRALKIEVGEWSKLVFVDSRFEMDYIEKQLIEAGKYKNHQAHKEFQEDMEI